LVLALGLVGCQSEEPRTTAKDSSKDSTKPTATHGLKQGPVLTLTLSCDKQVYVLGRDLRPKFSALISGGTDRVVVVGCLDGSDQSRRYPYYRVTAATVGPVNSALGPSSPISRIPYRACGNMNPLRAEDFKEIGFSGSFDPFGEGFFKNCDLEEYLIFDKTGLYEIVLTYDTDTTDDTLFQGNNTPPSQTDKVARVLRTKLVSNRLNFVIRDP
ncbi:MAG: hypothetical protein ACAI25_03140, partial [Planctomycetota bacterium]